MSHNNNNINGREKLCKKTNRKICEIWEVRAFLASRDCRLKSFVRARENVAHFQFIVVSMLLLLFFMLMIIDVACLFNFKREWLPMGNGWELFASSQLNFIGETFNFLPPSTSRRVLGALTWVWGSKNEMLIIPKEESIDNSRNKGKVDKNRAQEQKRRNWIRIICCTNYVYLA